MVFSDLFPPEGLGSSCVLTSRLLFLSCSVWWFLLWCLFSLAVALSGLWWTPAAGSLFQHVRDPQVFAFSFAVHFLFVLLFLVLGVLPVVSSTALLPFLLDFTTCIYFYWLICLFISISILLTSNPTSSAKMDHNPASVYRDPPQLAAINPTVLTAVDTPPQQGGWAQLIAGLHCIKARDGGALKLQFLICLDPAGEGTSAECPLSENWFGAVAILNPTNSPRNSSMMPSHTSRTVECRSPVFTVCVLASFFPHPLSTMVNSRRALSLHWIFVPFPVFPFCLFRLCLFVSFFFCLPLIFCLAHFYTNTK